MNIELAAALGPIVKDLRAGCAVFPSFGDASGELGGDWVGIWLTAADGSGQVVSVVPGTPPAEQVASLADQVQEWAVEALWLAGLPAVWPPCPDTGHTHPLAARVTDGTAQWVCPRTGVAAAEIGGLAGL
jgi:hypothetical protein